MILVTKLCVCVCVCVAIPYILDVRFVDVPAGVTQEGDNTGFLIHLPSAVLALILRVAKYSCCTVDIMCPCRAERFQGHRRLVKRYCTGDAHTCTLGRSACLATWGHTRLLR